MNCEKTESVDTVFYLIGVATDQAFMSRTLSAGAMYSHEARHNGTCDEAGAGGSSGAARSRKAA